MAEVKTNPFEQELARAKEAVAEAQDEGDVKKAKRLGIWLYLTEARYERWRANHSVKE